MGTTSTGNFRSLVRLCGCAVVRVSQVLSQVSVPVILIGITYFLRENGYHIWVDGQYVRGRRTVCKRGGRTVCERGEQTVCKRGGWTVCEWK